MHNLDCIAFPFDCSLSFPVLDLLIYCSPYSDMAKHLNKQQHRVLLRLPIETFQLKLKICMTLFFKKKIYGRGE